MNGATIMEATVLSTVTETAVEAAQATSGSGFPIEAAVLSAEVILIALFLALVIFQSLRGRYNYRENIIVT